MYLIKFFLLVYFICLNLILYFVDENTFYCLKEFFFNYFKSYYYILFKLKYIFNVYSLGIYLNYIIDVILFFKFLLYFISLLSLYGENFLYYGQ
jgi:hypothetical protein